MEQKTSHKGQWCSYEPNRFCQEGWCDECDVYRRWEKSLYEGKKPEPQGRSSDCCELVAIMEGFLADEESGAANYQKMLGELELLSGSKEQLPARSLETELFETLIFNMAEDEKRHRKYLEVMSSALSNICKCNSI